MLRFSSSPIIAAFAHFAGSQEEIARLEEVMEEVSDQEEAVCSRDEAHQEEVSQQRKRKLQQVVSIGSRREVVCWMIEECEYNGKKDLFSKAVANFPHLFHGAYKANIQKASSWWKLKDQFSEASKCPESLQRNQQFNAKRVNFKAATGRGRKTKNWVAHVYVELIEEFHHLRKTGLKFSTALLGTLARDIIKSDEGVFNADFRDADGKLILDKITTRWVQTFMAKHNVVARAQTVKLLCSPEKELHFEKTIAYHLGELFRGFSSGELDENLIENMDETHFVVNVDNGRTLGIRGDNDVKYADVVSGGECMTMMVRITGGVSSHIEAPMIIFTNKNRSYPIQGFSDDVPGASYRTGPKGWNDMQVFPQWLSEPCAFQPDRYGRQKLLFLDNCGGHNESDELSVALTRTKTTLRFFPPCATDKVQPADSFIISKIKDAWTKRWESKKMEMIREQQWSNGVRRGGGWLGKLLNPGKRYFLQLAADSVRDVNLQRDANGLTYARKAMIRCGLALDVTGEWHIKQLTPELQAIIMKHRNHFDGEIVPNLN